MPPTRLINAAVGHHLSSPTVGPVHHRQPPPNSLHPRAPQISPLATPGYFAGVHLGLSPAPSNSSTPLRSPPRPPLATLQEFTWTSVQHLQTPRHPSHLPPGHPRLLCRSSPGPRSPPGHPCRTTPGPLSAGSQTNIITKHSLQIFSSQILKMANIFQI